MADGWRPERRKEQFTAPEAEQLGRAAKRLAAAFGYGSGWKSPTLELPDTETWGEGMAPLSIAHRGHVTEQAARSIDGGRHVRRQHAWTNHAGMVAVPTASPDPMGQAALSYARLRGPLEPLLLAYALESMPHWLATAMQASPSTHFVSFAQSILYRGAGLDVVWPQFLATALIGGLFFGLALLRFRSAAGQGC